MAPWHSCRASGSTLPSPASQQRAATHSQARPGSCNSAARLNWPSGAAPTRSRPGCMTRCRSLWGCIAFVRFAQAAGCILQRLCVAPSSPAQPCPRLVLMQARQGDVVAVRVGGSFTYQPGDERRPLLLLAGGIGINPLLSILQHCCELAGYEDQGGSSKDRKSVV